MRTARPIQGVELERSRPLFDRARLAAGQSVLVHVGAGGVGGFGVQLKRKQFLWRLDYGFTDLGAFGMMHYISMELSPLWAKERTRHGRAGR